MHLCSFRWNGIPEVLTGLQMCTCCLHGYTPFFLLHKQDPVVLARQMEPDDLFLITCNVSEDAKGELAE